MQGAGNRLIPTGVCWCGCRLPVDLGSFFAPGHDKKAESRVIMEVFGGVPRFVDTFGYGPDGSHGAGTSWIDHVMRLRRVGANVREKCALEYPNSSDRSGPLERTEFNVQLLLPLNLDGSLSLAEGAVAFAVRGDGGQGLISVPFGDLSAVYQVSVPGPYWVVRTSGSLAFDAGVRYLPFGSGEPKGLTARGALRLRELAPLKDAAMTAWRRASQEHLPPLHTKSVGAGGSGLKQDFAPWSGFHDAVDMLTIDDSVLHESCADFGAKFGALDDAWFAARLQLARAIKQDAELIHGQIGKNVIEEARAAYVKLMRRIEVAAS